MPTSFLSIVSYVLISTFSPGPSNISSASMAVLHGYKKTLGFQAGLAMGVFLLMAVIGWFSKAVLQIFPSIEPIMRYAGAIYILYLAFGILRASYSITENSTTPMGLANGLMLQILNPKLTVYAFTLFSAFLAPITTNVSLLLAAATLLAFTSFCATSAWALFGSAVQTYLRDPRWRFVVNLLLSASLLYAALTLIKPA